MKTFVCGSALFLCFVTLLVAPSSHAEEAAGHRNGVVFDTIGEAHRVDFALGLARWDESPRRRAITADDLARSAFNAMVVGPLYGEKRQPPEEYALKPLTELLVDSKVRRAALYARNYQQISAFGGARHEGVHVLELEAPLGDAAGALIAKLGEMGAEQREVAGQQVLVAEWHFEKEPYLRRAPWEALVVVWPEVDSTRLVYATSLAALEDYVENPPEESVAQLKKKHTLVARPGVAAWVACLSDDKEKADEGTTPQVQFLMAWSEQESVPTFDMLFFPAVKDHEQLARRHPLVDVLLNPLPTEPLKSIEGGSHLELKLRGPTGSSPEEWTAQERREHEYKLNIGMFVGSLLLERNR